ncbi:abortive infection protein, partial [Halobiforma nitratireducens JCM 10879]
MSALTQTIRERPVLSYFVLTLTYSWVIWAPMLMIPGPGEIGPGESDTIIWIGVLLMYLGGFGPLVAAAIVVKFAGGDLRTWASQILTWRVNLRWWLATLGLPIVAVAGVSILYIAIGGPYDFGALMVPILSYVPLYPVARSRLVRRTGRADQK